jgi:CheY-like chemotaxis protein
MIVATSQGRTKAMASNVVHLPSAPQWRVLIAHHEPATCSSLRALIDTEDIAVVEAMDGEAAIAELATRQFDLLILELDLPEQDGITVMKLHRILLAHQPIRVPFPAVIFTLAPEVRDNPTLLDHLKKLGIAGVIDDLPRSDVASLVTATLKVRTAQLFSGNPAAA